MPIAHTTLLVADIEASKAFYTAALAPLNYKVGMEFPPHSVGFEFSNGKNDFWLASTGGSKVPNIHLAFYGDSEEMVQGFHAAALKAGATCNGPPGLRPQYGPGYYASFIKDLDGNNMECVYYKPQ